MQQYYTLEEAAHKLGMSVDALREMAKRKEIRAFQDRGNWRFRAQEIDERARQLGAGSDPELQLGDPRALARGGSPKPAPRPDFTTGSEDDIEIPIPPPRASGNPSSSKRLPKSVGDSDVRLVMDDPPGKKGDSDVRLSSPSPKPTKRGGDSGVRLDKRDPGSDSDVKLVEEGKPASDSDIRLQDLPEPKRSGKGEANLITEEIDLDAEEARLARQQPQPARPRGPSPARPNAPVLPSSSPYELSEADLGLDDVQKKPRVGKPPEDSSSEHELIAFDAAKARGGDLGSGEIPLLSDDSDIGLVDLPPPSPGNSGINLNSPVDSGISLESGGSDELEFELSLDSGSTPKPAKQQHSAKEDSSSEFELSLDDDAPSDTSSSSEFELSLDEGTSAGVPDLALEKVDNSDSEFELTLDDEGGLGVDDGGKDIFETNIDLPSLEDSSSQVAALEASDTDLESDSEFELSMDEGAGEASGSQVVAIDGGDEADDVAATVAKPRDSAKPLAGKAKPKAKPARLDEDEPEEDFDEPAPKKKPGKKPAADLDEDLEEDEELRPVAAAPPADWGPLPAVLLFPTVIVLFFVGLMGYEMIQGMWGYHRSTKVGKPIIDAVARMIDDTIPKE
jgi:excisionase family DNA binding protein